MPRQVDWILLAQSLFLNDANLLLDTFKATAVMKSDVAPCILCVAATLLLRGVHQRCPAHSLHMERENAAVLCAGHRDCAGGWNSCKSLPA
ncbi:hypothetical protein DVH05_026856 [Phytophthora capsici]|nr:hypothetical protein DVH05_026856 [Phytophthora capsici]